MKMNEFAPQENIKLEQEKGAMPFAVISRKIKIRKGQYIYSEEQRTFPIFKKEPDQDSLVNALKNSATETYGIITGTEITVYQRGNEEPISKIEYREIDKDPDHVFIPRTLP